jgi:hypothetical protein
MALKRDLIEDIYRDDEVLNKIRTRDDYAQNLYAAWCNMQWCPKELWPTLRQDPDKDLWTASWRGAGGIIAQFRKEGDYMDWYCSGMGGLATYDVEEGEAYMAKMKYVPEGIITDEIAADLNRLGWFPVPYEDDGI